jgi:hypothetical protein
VFRNQVTKANDGQPLELQKPPADGPGEEPWWDKYWTDPQEELDRELLFHLLLLLENSTFKTSIHGRRQRKVSSNLS